MKLLVENKAAADGSEHLIEVGDFGSYADIARAAYVHMNGPRTDGHGPSETDLETMGEAIKRDTTSHGSLFRGMSEDSETYSFYVELEPDKGGR